MALPTGSLSQLLFRSRRTLLTIIVSVSVFLLGTVVVLSFISYSLAIPKAVFLSEKEVPWKESDVIHRVEGPQEAQTRAVRQQSDNETSGHDNDKWTVGPESHLEDDRGVEAEAEEGEKHHWMREDWDGRVHGCGDWSRLYNTTPKAGESMPRLIHQTWKDDQLPEKWRDAFKECREGMPDYEYMLWTDQPSRKFIEAHYPGFLLMYDSYRYPIQRADAIRYFVLHHFGGIYMDLDMGCRRKLDPLLQGNWDVVLPVTIPVGVSNDMILSVKGSRFMEETIHALPRWDHNWLSNYPTVMFSTGPMFLSAQFASYMKAHPRTSDHPHREVRVLPKSLYGKNVPIDTVPHAFFVHFYGSSWHSDDAGFVAFLGTWGKWLMFIGSVLVLGGVLRLAYLSRGAKEIRGGYEPLRRG